MSGGITLDSTDGATQIEGADGTLADVVEGQDGVKRLQIEVSGGGGGGVTDHGDLGGLGDDDHFQYLNETRHDALPSDNPHGVTKAQVGLGDVPNTDFTAPVAANTAKVSFPEAPNDGQEYVRKNEDWAVAATGVTDHGALTGLADDDHTQYLTETRHDALPQDNPHGVTAAQAGADPAGTAAAAISAHEAAGDPHPQYETSAEAQAKVDTHANRTDNPHSVTKAQVGLGNADNTSDLDKPISNATQAELLNRLDKRNIGWINWSSTQSVSYSFGARNQILFNTGRTTLDTYAPAGGTPVLSDPGSRVFPQVLGESGILRLTIDATANQGDKQLTLELDISNTATPNIIWSTTIRTPKGGGNQKRYTVGIPFFALGTFLANGGAFYGTFDTTGTIANASLLYIRTGRP